MFMAVEMEKRLMVEMFVGEIRGVKTDWMCVRGEYKKMKDGENENMIKRKVINRNEQWKRY